MEGTPIPQIASVAPVETTADERTMAVLANALQMVGGWIGPLIIFFAKRQSRFVSFHALQALLLQAVHVVFIMALWCCVVRADLFSNPFGAGSPFFSPPLIIFSFYSAVLGLLDGALDIHAGDYHSVQHQSRTRRVGGVSHFWQDCAAYFEDGARWRAAAILTTLLSILVLHLLV